MPLTNTDTRRYTLALAGNPNVGKSSVFNNLTNLNQHTGNWAGKTVEICKGYYKHNNAEYELVDLPGTYSLFHNSSEEEITERFLAGNEYDCIIIIVDSTTLERNLLLTLQILSKTNKAFLCLNMSDDAERKGIVIDSDELSLQLGIPVIKTSSRDKASMKRIKETAENLVEESAKTFSQNRFLKINEFNSSAEATRYISTLTKEIYDRSIISKGTSYTEKDIRLDHIFTSRSTGIPIMISLFLVIFWITAVGANYPSRALSSFLFMIKDYLWLFLNKIGSPYFFSSMILDGVYTTVAWVVSVMLPPAMIFFPLFALLEDFGYIPRVVFCLDRFFSKVGTTGKQAIAMALGFGCNACGVTGCRIMKTQKEKILLSITNSFIPCNGRLPTIISLISIFLAGSLKGVNNALVTAATLMLILALCVASTFVVCAVINRLYKKDENSAFILELPPLRKPQFAKCIARCMKEKVLYVLSRALLVSAPAGAILWLLSAIELNDKSILNNIAEALRGTASLFGIDGVILTALILSFPANELIFPIMLMIYMSGNTLTDYESLSQLESILSANGWTVITAICVIILIVFRYPCSTTCFVIKKETNRVSVLISSILIPTLLGLILSFFASTVYQLIVKF